MYYEVDKDNDEDGEDDKVDDVRDVDLSMVGKFGRVEDGEGEMSSRLRRRLRADA